jgi:hypothetical protein
MFDPIIALNGHIALLTIIETAKQDLPRMKGLQLLALKGLGRMTTLELEKSKAKMKLNKMWVQEVPLGERRYRYVLNGIGNGYEISQADLDLHLGMTMGEFERQLERNGNSD